VQITQYEKNPSGVSGYTSRVNRTANATVSISSFTAAGWPVDGTTSHAMTASGTGIARVGTVNTDRPAAAPGDRWSLWVRVMCPQAWTVGVRIVFYDTYGATTGTELKATAASASFAAGQVQTLRIDGTVAPAGTASVEWQITRTSGSAGDVYYDAVSFTKTDAAVPFRSGAFAVWDGTENASTQTYWIPTFTLTPRPANEPPYVEVALDDLPPVVDRVTVYRTAGGREHEMRGAINASVAGALSRIDWECPFNMAATYRAEMFDSDGVSLGFTPAASITVVSADSWMHNPLDPQGAVRVRLLEGTAETLERKVPVTFSRPIGRRVAVALAEPRQGLTGLAVNVYAPDVATADRVQAMLGDYTTTTVPVVCIRVGAREGAMRIPRPLFLGVASIVEKDVGVRKGLGITRQEMVGDESAPPVPGLIVPLLTRDDIDAYYATRDDIDAAYLRRIDLDRDYSLAGYANA